MVQFARGDIEDWTQVGLGARERMGKGCSRVKAQIIAIRHSGKCHVLSS